MTAGVPLPDAPPSLADRPAFSADGVVFTVADLVRRTGSGGREGRFGGQGLTPGQVEEAFRRGRGLLRADQLDGWLAAWEISADDFRSWTHDVASGTATASTWCALLCSGRLDAVTAEVAAAAAAACELGAGPRDPASFDPAGWVERLVAARTDDEGLRAVIGAHRLDWTRLDTVRVTVPARGIAEELRQQVLVDGAGLEGPTTAGILADTVPTGVRTALAGARAGELVGPLPADDAWTLVHVLDRTEATLDDPATRARAEAAVRNDVIAHAVARHVVA